MTLALPASRTGGRPLTQAPSDRTRRARPLLLALPAALALLVGAAPDALAGDLALAPWPAAVERRDQALPVEGRFVVEWSGFRDAGLERAAARFVADLDRRTGLSGARPGPRLVIAVKGDDPGRLTPAAKEAYTLEVGPAGATLTADGPVGALRGLATLRQMVVADAAGFSVPAARIEDAPRFAWRGLMIDPVRHFIGLDTLKRQIDMMERVKLNVLHLHLSDNEGFRVESLRYPRLTEVASHGQYYTQAEIRDLVAYAADRGVRVVPEIDLPAHTGAILTAYPELAAGPFDPGSRIALFSVAMDPSRPETYAFVQGLLEEMSALFPDAYFHVGGDEVSPAAWASRPQVEAFKVEHGYADDRAVQDHFFRRVKAVLDGLGKTAVGWEEVAHGPVADDVVVQAWRSSEATHHATAQGNRVVVSAGYYLDLLWPGVKHYGVDPLDSRATPPNLPNERLGPAPERPLDAAQRGLVLGAEAALWSETVTEETLETRLWPRAALLAERFWSPAEVRDFDDAARRVVAVQEGLRIQGLQDAAVRRRMAARWAPADAEAVETLAAAAAPVRNMGRLADVFAAYRAGRPLRLPELNALVDTAAPDSVEMLRLTGRVDAWLDGDAAQLAPLRAELARYRDNHPRFVAAARGVPALEPAVPVSADVAALARIGLEALDLVEAKRRPTAAWRAQAQALLGRQRTAEAASATIPTVVGGAVQPPSKLLVLLTPIVARLVEATP